MPQPTPSVTYNTLRQNTHRVNDGMTPSLFATPDAPEFNNTEYWMFSDLCKLFPDYISMDYMSSALGNAMNFATDTLGKNKSTAGQTFAALYNRHIQYTSNTYTINNQTHKNASDARLTRFACWALLQQYPKLIFAHLFFIMPDSDFKTLYDASNKFCRIYWRNIIAQHQRTISGIICHHTSNPALYNHTSGDAFFAHKHPQDIKDKYHIPQIDHDPLRNYMLPDSLVAYAHALKNAIYKYDIAPNKTLQALTNALESQLTYARYRLIQTTGHAPEQDLSPTPISQIQSEYKKLEREFIKKYSKQSLR